MGRPVIVEAVRTPIGKRNGLLSGVHAAALLGQTQRQVLERVGVDPRDVDQVVGGCVTAIGEQAFNVSRMAWLGVGLPIEVGASTVDVQCGSSQQANHFVSNLIAADAIAIGIACGVEMMSRVAIGANTANGPGAPRTPDFPHDMPNQFKAAERIAEKFAITREEVDAFGQQSHERALLATEQRRFAREITPVAVTLPDGRSVSYERDEGPRPSTRAQLARLRPILPDGVHTAANTSQLSDGAAAVLWMDEARARALGLTPRARLVAQVVVGTDPYYHLLGPIDATRALLKRARMTLNDIDLFEINEAFAAVALAWQKTCGVAMDRLNVNGGAIALGHPMGCTGARLFTTALHELERTGRSTALIAMCCGGAVATGSIIERV